MPTDDTSARRERVAATREIILDTAEQLFAERGVFSVSNRQVSLAAGQGNNTAVGYHFGDKLDLVRAIVRRHFTALDDLRERLVAQMGESAGLADWVGCMVLPMTQHLDALGTPTWFARFNAQLTTDPGLRSLMAEEATTSPSLLQVVDRVRTHTSALSENVRGERHAMARHLLTHVCSERERALADDAPTHRSTWQATGLGLIDATVAIWQAPAR